MVQVIGNPRIVILGAGPTGLGAAHRLTELHHENFAVYEATDTVGGLARSHTDDAGFVWDMGGHVQFSHYRYFDELMDRLLEGQWIEHQRAASVWIAGRFVPYPFQHHLDALPEPLRIECQRSLERASLDSVPVHNFREWIVAQFGQKIADVFMLPYNKKVWAVDPGELSTGWIGERVATAKAPSQRGGWGPNSTFRFPRRGGTGEIWRRLAALLPPDRVHFHKRAVRVEPQLRRVHFSDDSVEDYDILISTMPLDTLVDVAGLTHLQTAANTLMHSSVHVVGMGLHGVAPDHLAARSWMYFPEDDCPFYRATVFSNYAPANVPDPARTWSLMLEVSESSSKPVDATTIVQEVIAGLCATKLIDGAHQVASTWHTRLEHGYPIPSLGRDAALRQLLPALEPLNIYSRGRFGAWKYEVSNQDHSLMQGVEVVDRLLSGKPETTLPAYD